MIFTAKKVRMTDGMLQAFTKGDRLAVQLEHNVELP